MQLYIIRYLANDDPPLNEVAAVGNFPGLKIQDSSLRMLLVEASDQVVKAFKVKFPGWSVSPEQSVPCPQPPRETVRRRIKK